MPRSRFLSRRLVRVSLSRTVLLFAACGKQEEQSAQSDMKVPVQVVQVNPKPTPLYIDLPGRADAIKDAQVRARVTGIVTGIHFDQGSDVDEGQLLFTIDPAPYERSEEHTSELQSRGHLVCRLLREK